MKRTNLILIKCVEREISVLGLFNNKANAEEALAKDFLTEINQGRALDNDEIDEVNNLVSERLKDLNKKSEPITNYDNYEIDLDAGSAWFNGKDYNFDWKIINLEEI